MISASKSNLIFSVFISLAILTSILLAGIKLQMRIVDQSKTNNSPTPTAVENEESVITPKSLTIHKLLMFDENESFKLIGYDDNLIVTWDNKSNQIRTLRNEPNVTNYALSPNETFLAYTKTENDMHQIFVDNLKDQKPPELIHSFSSKTKPDMELRYSETFAISDIRFTSENELYVFADKLYRVVINPNGLLTEVNYYTNQNTEEFCADTFDTGIKSPQYLVVQFGCFEGTIYSLFDIQKREYVDLQNLGIYLGGFDGYNSPLAIIDSTLYVQSGFGSPTDTIFRYNLTNGKKLNEFSLPTYILSKTASSYLKNNQVITSNFNDKFVYAYLGSVYSSVGYGPIVYDLTNQEFLSWETMSENKQFIIQTEKGVYYTATENDFTVTLNEESDSLKIFDNLDSYYFY